MRELSPSDLQRASAGFDSVAAALRAFGIINSALGYVTATRTLQQWGVQGAETVTGAASAAILSRFATHPLWDAPGHAPADGTSAAMAGCFLLGAGVGLAEGIITTATTRLWAGH